MVAEEVVKKAKAKGGTNRRNKNGVKRKGVKRMFSNRKDMLRATKHRRCCSKDAFIYQIHVGCSCCGSSVLKTVMKSLESSVHLGLVPANAFADATV